MRSKLLALGLAILGLLTAAGAALAVWRRMGREAAAETAPPPPPFASEPMPMAPPVPAAPPAAMVATEDAPTAGVVPPELDPHPTGVFAAIGRFVYRFRKVIPAVGLAIVIGLVAWSNMAGGRLIQGGWFIEGSEERAAAELLSDRFGEAASTVLVVYEDPDGDAADADFQEGVADSLEPIADDPLVDEIITYGAQPADQLLSRDGSKTIAIVTLTANEEEAVEEIADLTDQIEAPEGVEIEITGVPQIYHEFTQRLESDLIRSELISLPIALLILLAVFGTLVGSVLPLLIAGLALPATFAIVSIVAGITDVSVFVNNLASMIGLALAIDYSLFMVSRFREELRHHSVEISIERMMGSVGKAVAVSGVAVAIGLSSLMVFEADALRSMGLGGLITVLATLLFGLTVLPALLAMLGARVNRLPVPLPRALRLVDEDPEAVHRRGHGLWSRIADRVMRRPLLIGLPVLALMLFAGSPFLSIELGTGGNLEDLPNTPARQGFFTVIEEFPGMESDPIAVALRYEEAAPGEDGLSTEQQEELAAYVDELTAIDRVTSVESVLDPPPGMPADQYAMLLSLPPDERPPEAREALDAYLDDLMVEDTLELTVASSALPDSDAGRGVVDAVRDTETPAGTEALTAGLPSRSLDFIDSFYAAVPIAVLIVVAVTGAVLFLTFGSVFLPVKAVLMSLVSISASLGALVWIFQQGHLSEVLRFDASGTTAAWLPIIMFAILFGLSMDYEVLLLSRIRERYLTHGENTRAVAEGIGMTGGIITGAALIMVGVFLAFSLSSIVFLKALGFTMALAVLIDATIVRGILVPAFMRVMGSVNWWAPRWIQRIVARLGLYESGEAAKPAVP
ncbi:MAG TPA: MMPL family transporter [Candidatus Limnocylindria bacterium]|nr:MMPL family transporter [Candidatus Limnocylindria bacterium]